MEWQWSDTYRSSSDWYLLVENSDDQPTPEGGFAFFLVQKDKTNSTEFPSAQVDGSLSGLDEAAIIGADDADAETNGRTNEWWHMDDSNMTRLQWDIWKFRGMLWYVHNGWIWVIHEVGIKMEKG